ncbi:DUF58 domain-containing protein [Tabrizicola sp.]|uniref:DUF58 domain-containing protein n=1 Tax=Tabrizicola sp. TaxID=2005166 RepID=UPI003F4082D1
MALAPWIVLVALAGIDVLLSLSGRKAVVLDMAPEVFVGETVLLKLKVTPAPLGLIARFDWPEGLSGPTETGFSGDTATVPCRAVRRGVWSLSQLWLLWPSRLKLFEFTPRLPVKLEVRVVPNIRPVQSGQITTTVMSTLYGVKENRAIGEGSEFHQLREFVRGMDVKTIDWKASARRRSLVARELQAERNHHVILALDTGYLMREDIAGLPKIDHATTAALAVAWAAAVGGDLVGYFAYDVRPRTFVAPRPGRTAFARLRSWTADLAYVGRETNHTLALTELNARTPKRSLIIIFTDFVDTTSAELMIENIGILARRHLVVFVTIRDPELEAVVERSPDDLDGVATLVAANQWVQDRRRVLERLVRLGVTIVDAKPNAVTARLISTYLDIKAKDLI